ncbi:asparaginyl-tRNA synthetase [Cordyceps fumosorosea ARSEF 2679]|uniref:asparagine--tRNA ligase n=1 Tax=Cordyceps fumosorosea (strain ARSEF 2679) TaxID=1081104 RepID=A0A168CHC8_CORFA|nr:asparaginyl-tRNA synthetase [Cordyceps fumosorosea ARSEF 2679]OAA71377.1 asparaginyl-tRNA synthetase [Cordyceps fumosorosea ARSEF 2679]
MAAVQELAERVKRSGDICYVDTDVGVDEPTADGTEAKPFKTLPFAYIQKIDHHGTQFLSRASVTGPLADGEDPAARLAWKEPAKSAVKKAQSVLDIHKKKLVKQQAAQAAEDAKKKARLDNLEAAKKIVLVQDASLPAAVKMGIANKDVELGDGKKKGARVKVSGRIHRLRAQKQATFITLIDGYGHLQCVLQSGDLTKTYDALTFAQGTSLTLYGEMRKVPDGQQAPDGRELHVDYYEVIGASPGDDEAITNKVSVSQNQWDQGMLDNRHLVLRGDNAASLMKLRSQVEWAFIKTYNDMKFVKVSPPALVQTQVEGGATLFKVPYYDEEAYLTQSSQLYLETVLPSLGNVYCIEKSFRAEKSLTRRHLSEYSHVEAELDFVTFDDLLEHLEELMCRVIDSVLGDPETAAFLKELNPTFARPQRPFMRMRYSDAIDWLNAQDPPILNEEDKPHVFGDDIAEAAERKMTDAINRPIFLTHFPAEIKAFYMKKDPQDRRVTESVDCLMPGVGEIVGGSMRMEDLDELLQAYKTQGIDAKDYYWYTDQRKYGTSPHGGYGLGLERFLAWMANQHTVRTTCLYPRFMGRCKP